MDTYRGPRKGLIIIVIIIGILILGSESTGKRVDDSFTPTGEITNIKIDNFDGDVKLVSGDSFYVKGEDLIEDSYSFSQEGDTLIIKTNDHDGFVFHIGFFDSCAKVTVTVPSTTQFNVITIANGSGDLDAKVPLDTKQCSITAGSGNVMIESLKAENFDVSVGSGDFEVNNLTASTVDASVGSGNTEFGYVEGQKMDVSIGSGDFTFKSLEVRDCEFDLGSGNLEGKNMQVMNMAAETGSGDIYLEGELTGVSSFSCGSGNIELELSGNKDDYSYELKGADIEVDGKNYGKKYKSDTVKDKQLHLETNSGEIEVRFR